MFTRAAKRGKKKEPERICWRGFSGCAQMLSGKLNWSSRKLTLPIPVCVRKLGAGQDSSAAEKARLPYQQTGALRVSWKWTLTWCCSVAKMCPTLCNPMDCNMPGFLFFTISGVCSDSCALSPWCHPWCCQYQFSNLDAQGSLEGVGVCWKWGFSGLTPEIRIQ